MNRSEQITSLATALAKAQGEFGKILKGKSAEISAGRGYKYADLAAVCEAIVPVLSAHDIAILQGSPPDRLDVIETMLVHGKSGEWIATYAPIYEGRNGGAQGYGSGVTYARRYALLAAVGVAPEDDDDGAKASGSNQRAAMHASSGIDQAWRDAVEDGLPEGATDRQRAEAYTNAVIFDLQKPKTPRGVDGAWTKRQKIIERLKAAHPDLYDNILDAYQGAVNADSAEKETA